jgi:hypothetical protein
MMASPLLKALRGSASPPLRPVPAAVAELLQRLESPPRLAAHLRAGARSASQEDHRVQRACAPNVSYAAEFAALCASKSASRALLTRFLTCWLRMLRG